MTDEEIRLRERVRSGVSRAEGTMLRDINDIEVLMFERHARSWEAFAVETAAQALRAAKEKGP